MFCMKCQHDVVDCTCPDIHERLKSVGPEARPAALQNLTARAVKKSLETGMLAHYEDEGQRMVVKVLEDLSTPEMTRYKLEVVKQLSSHWLCRDAVPGEVFECCANPEYAGYVGWTLEPAE